MPKYSIDIDNETMTERIESSAIVLINSRPSIEEALPAEMIRREILPWLDGDSTYECSCVSKDWNEYCRQIGNIEPTIELRPKGRRGKRDKDGKWTIKGSTQRAFKRLMQGRNRDKNQAYDWETALDIYDALGPEYNTIMRYTRLKVTQIERFDNTARIRLPTLEEHEKMYWVHHLDLSSSPSISPACSSSFMKKGASIWSLPHGMANLLPNLIKVDLSNTNIKRAALGTLLARCDHIVKLKWNNVPLNFGMHLDGRDFNSLLQYTTPEYHATFYLNEIILDDTTFVSDTGSLDYDSMTDLKGFEVTLPPYIFKELMKDAFSGSKFVMFERFSIRNAKIHYVNETRRKSTVTMPQSALIKFIRKIPKNTSLKWFRSDLTKANIEMLQKERPNIQLVN